MKGNSTPGWTETKRSPEMVKLANDMYALVFTVLSPHETRGFNAHSRTQRIVEDAVKAASHWVSIQKERE